MYVQYLKLPNRRPIWVGPRPPFTDLQGAIPRAWCRFCGAEVFEEHREQCSRCQKEEQKNVCEKLQKPL